MRLKRLLSILLAGALQLLPMLRAVLPIEARGLAPASWAWILKVGGGAVALLGSYDAVSGATQIVQPYTVNATVGTPYSRQLTTSGQTAHSWSANTAPLGTAAFPLTPGLWLTNSNGRIGGVPTWAGVSNITISAWENGGNSGASVSSLFVFTITNNTPPPPTPPSITAQPRSLTNNLNTTATFTLTASGTAPLSYQWRFQGNPIASATLTSYSIPSVQLTDAGSYSVVVTNVAGSVTSSNAVLTVVQQADLAVLAAGPASVLAGSNVLYTITVTNQGPSAANGVVVSDALPAGAAFVSASGGGVASAGTVTWPSIAALASGAAASFTATVTAPASGSLTNVASCTSATTDPVPANNNGTAANSRVVTSITAQSDLSVLCSGPAAVNAGAALTYTITVTNLGPSSATGVIVTDTLPPGVAFLNATGGGVASAGTVTWPAVASLPIGSTLSYVVNVTAPAGGSLTNIVSCSAATLDPQISNNDGTSAASRVVTAVQPQADLAVLVSGPAAVLPGSNLTYTITLTNQGPSPAASVALIDQLPAGATFISASGGGVAGSGTVTWPTVATVNSGTALSYTVTVAAPGAGSLTNSASCTSSTPDPSTGNNDGTAAASMVITTVGQQADLAVLMGGPASVLPGANLTYTLTVTNLGPSAATNVVIADTLPPAATFVSATGGGVASAGTITWPTVASLGSGASVVFNVTVTAPAGGSLTNIGAATSATPDPDTANNDGSTPVSRSITSVTPQADLLVTATGPAAVNAGANLAYVLVVSNQGPSTAANIVVSDAMPSGATFVSATGGGVASAGTVTWPAIPSLASGASASFSLTVRAPGTGPLTNRGSCSSTTVDPSPGNNDGTSPAATVVTTVQPQADLAVLCSGPASVTVGVPFSYAIVVTNSGLSTAGSVSVSDLLPAGLSFVSASGGGGLSGNTVTWPLIASLASGANATFTLTVTAPAAGGFTNAALAAAATPDPNPANNDGSAQASRVSSTAAVATAQFGITGGVHTVNPQTGLVEESVSVANTGAATIAAFRLYATGLRNGVQLVNATGTNAGRPYVQYNASLNPGQAVTLVLEFFVADRGAFTDTLSAEAVLPAAAATTSSNGLAIARAFMDSRAGGAPRFVIEFPSTPGQEYTVIYSDNSAATWKVATPSITASASITQWYDDGPPKTDSAPSTSPSRLYRVIAGPANP